MVWRTGNLLAILPPVLVVCLVVSEKIAWQSEVIKHSNRWQTGCVRPWFSCWIVRIWSWREWARFRSDKRSETQAAHSQHPSRSLRDAASIFLPWVVFVCLFVKTQLEKLPAKMLSRMREGFWIKNSTLKTIWHTFAFWFDKMCHVVIDLSRTVASLIFWTLHRDHEDSRIT